MARSRQVKVTLMFPIRDNDGKPFPLSTWRWWRDEMTRIFGAFTTVGRVTGYWEGMLDDHCLVFAILRPAGRARERRALSQVRRFLATAKKLFRQKKMFFEYHPVSYEEV
ncbi:MAG: hypothetical protein HYZ53_29530 [Planctomycetes bacterium]|nr:hypothetical protein [Planctomycetota bacterium]